MATTLTPKARPWHRDRFYPIGGRQFPSVTTILEVVAKPALGPWYAKEERRFFETVSHSADSAHGLKSNFFGDVRFGSLREQK